MDTIKANIDSLYDVGIILEFENDRYGESVISPSPFQKKLISKITELSKELHEKSKNNSNLFIITSMQGAELFDNIMKQNFED